MFSKEMLRRWMTLLWRILPIAAGTTLVAAGSSCTTCACGQKRESPQAFDAYYSRYQIETPAAGMGPPPGSVRVTFYGTSTLLFDDGETQILVDGFVSRNGVFRAQFMSLHSDPVLIDDVVAQGGMEKVAAVFVTHSHYDHALDVARIIKAAEERSRMDAGTRERARAARPANPKSDCNDPDEPSLEHIILRGSESTLKIGRGGFLAHCQGVVLRPGEDIQVGKHFKVRAYLSKHSPATIVNNDLGEVIQDDLHQPAPKRAYKEGGAYDFLITYDDTRSILVKAGANYVEDMLKGVHADVVFLSIGRLGKQCCAFRDTFYDQTVGLLQPRLVIATHWDNFFKPLTRKDGYRLEPAPWFIDDVAAGLQFLAGKLGSAGIQFRLMQGFQSIDLFTGVYPPQRATP